MSLLAIVRRGFVGWFVCSRSSCNGERRFELFLITAACHDRAVARERAHANELFLGLYPIGLLALVYDSMRYWKIDRRHHRARARL